MGTKNQPGRRSLFEVPILFNQDSKVVDSRPTDEGMVIRRRRECNRCAKRFTTYEKSKVCP